MFLFSLGVDEQKAREVSVRRRAGVARTLITARRSSAASHWDLSGCLSLHRCQSLCDFALHTVLTAEHREPPTGNESEFTHQDSLEFGVGGGAVSMGLVVF